MKRNDIYTILTLDKKKYNTDYEEIYRQVRTNIEFSTVGERINTISITSAINNEAKTTTAINLATIYATKYNKVLLIDCHLREPSIHKQLHLHNHIGLTNALLSYAKQKQIDTECFQTINNSTFLKELTVLTAGTKTPNPAELLGSDYFKAYIAELKEIYDFIIIDCPSITTYSDAIPIGHTVDGTVLICSTKDTKRKYVQLALHTLQQNKVRVLGTILTKAETSDYGEIFSKKKKYILYFSFIIMLICLLGLIMNHHRLQSHYEQRQIENKLIIIDSQYDQT